MNAQAASSAALAVAVPEVTRILSLDAFEAEVAKLCELPWHSKFGALFLDRLDDPGPEHEWLIDGWLSAGDKSVIGGPSQSGKSFLAIHAGMCIAHGVEFFGCPVKAGLVIYQAGEGSRGVKKRLRAWRQHFGVKFSKETPFVLLQAKLDLYGSEDTPKLLAEIKGICAMYQVPLAMVVIDTLATAAIGAEENSAKDIGIVMNNIARINAETKAHVALVHHMNAGGDKLRGSTAIYANIDQSVFVKRDLSTNIRTAFLGKQRDDDGRTAIQFELKQIILGAEARTGRPITSCVCLPVGEKEAIRRLEENKGFALNHDESTFMRAYFTAEKVFGQPVPTDMNLPAVVRSVVSYTEVKRAYVKLNPSDALPEDAASEEEKVTALERHREALKKALQRLRKKLTDLRVIGIREDKIWWTGKVLRGFPETRPIEEDPDDIVDGSDTRVPF